MEYNYSKNDKDKFSDGFKILNYQEYIIKNKISVLII